MRNDSRRSTKSGTTLIELLISLVMIAIAGSALIESTRFCQLMTTKSRNQLCALNAAQSQLDVIRAQFMAGNVPVSTAGVSPIGLPSSSQITSTISIYNSLTGLYEADVRVSWTDSTAFTSGTLTLSSVIYAGEL